MAEPTHLIETSILVDMLRGYPPAKTWIGSLSPGQAAISFVHGMGFLDCLIGAAAHQHGLVLYALNDRHFSPLPGLQVARPY